MGEKSLNGGSYARLQDPLACIHRSRIPYVIDRCWKTFFNTTKKKGKRENAFTVPAEPYPEPLKAERDEYDPAIKSRRSYLELLYGWDYGIDFQAQTHLKTLFEVNFRGLKAPLRTEIIDLIARLP